MNILAEFGISGSWPGAHCVHVERAHLDTLSRQRYVVSDKTDGTRSLLAILDGKAYLIDRKMEVTEASGPKTDVKALLDGEIVVVDGGARAFLVYDAIAGPNNVTHLALGERIAVAMRAVEGLTLCIASKPLYVAVKRFFDGDEIEEALEHFKGLPYPTDGIVMTPLDEPMVRGTSSKLLKWKPASDVTVDFLAKKDRSLFVVHNSSLMHVGRLACSGLDAVKADIVFENKDSAILECRLVKENWTLVKERTDKSSPNSRFVYHNCLKNIREEISLDEVISALKKKQ